MKFRIPVEELKWIIGVLGVTAKVNTVEIPGRILIKATDDSVTFLSNNGSTGVSIESTNVAVDEPGEVSVVFGNVKSFVSPFTPWDDERGVGAKDFLFKSAERNLIVNVRNKHESGKISNGRVKFSIYNAASIGDVPTFDGPTFTINSNAMKSAIGKVLYVVDPNCMVAALRGMCIRFTDKSIHFAGTDGKALSEFAIENTTGVKDETYVIKLDYIMGLRRLLVPDVEFEFEVKERSIIMRYDNILFWGQTIIGNEYPEYETIFNDYENKIVIDKEILTGNLLPFVDALDQKDYSRVSMKIENKKITLFNDSGSFICDCDFEFNGEHTIDLNGNILLRTIDAINDKEIAIKFSKDQSKNVLFDSANYENNQRALIVPLRARV